jgi:gas vesicle protein
MSDPDAIRAEIERTRGNLSSDVNAFTDRVSPGNVARRQVGKARGAAVGLKDRVMGTAHQAGEGMSSATSSASDSLSSASSALATAPDRVKTQTSGNPLAAGVIALGVGWLLGSAFPASTKETQLAGEVKANAGTLAQPLTDAAKEAAQELKEPAQQAVAAVRETATDAASTVKSEGQSAAQDVKGQAQDAKENVQQTRA